MGWSRALYQDEVDGRFWENRELLAWQRELPLPLPESNEELVLRGPGVKRSSEFGKRPPRPDASAIDRELDRIVNQGLPDIRLALPEADKQTEPFLLWWAHPWRTNQPQPDPGVELYEVFHKMHFRNQVAGKGRVTGQRHDYYMAFDLELTLSTAETDGFEAERFGHAHTGQFRLQDAGGQIALPPATRRWLEDTVREAPGPDVYIQARILGFTLLMGHHRERKGLPYRLLRYVRGVGAVHELFCAPQKDSEIHGRANVSDFDSGSAARLLDEHLARVERSASISETVVSEPVAFGTTAVAQADPAAAPLSAQSQIGEGGNAATPTAIEANPAVSNNSAKSRVFAPTPKDDEAASLAQQLGGIPSDSVGRDVLRLVNTRIGQGQFRAALLREFDGRCAVSALAFPAMLIASHIKPWAKCDESEFGDRLNPKNGLLLNPILDRLFDQGFITFDDDGTLLQAEELEDHEAIQKSIPPGGRLQERHIYSDERRGFLRWHRENVFVDR